MILRYQEETLETPKADFFYLLQNYPIMAMTCSQNLQSLGQDNEYDDDITVTEVPKGYFIAMTANSIAEGASTREIRIDLMAAEWADGGTNTVGSGMFVRQSGETAVQVKVYDGSTERCSNTTNYS